MENKRYLDKVVDHMVRGTKVDYDEGEIIFPFTTRSTPFSLSYFLSFNSFNYSLPFIKYCGDQFGLTEEEIDYVYDRYVKIIEDKYNK